MLESVEIVRVWEATQTPLKVHCLAYATENSNKQTAMARQLQAYLTRPEGPHEAKLEAPGVGLGVVARSR